MDELIELATTKNFFSVDDIHNALKNTKPSINNMPYRFFFNNIDSFAKYMVKTKYYSDTSNAEIINWLNKNCQYKHKQWSMCHWLFENKDDALLFKMVWY